MGLFKREPRSIDHTPCADVLSHGSSYYILIRTSEELDGAEIPSATRPSNLNVRTAPKSPRQLSVAHSSGIRVSSAWRCRCQVPNRVGAGSALRFDRTGRRFAVGVVCERHRCWIVELCERRMAGLMARLLAHGGFVWSDAAFKFRFNTHTSYYSIQTMHHIRCTSKMHQRSRDLACSVSNLPFPCALGRRRMRQVKCLRSFIRLGSHRPRTGWTSDVGERTQGERKI